MSSPAVSLWVLFCMCGLIHSRPFTLSKSTASNSIPSRNVIVVGGKGRLDTTGSQTSISQPSDFVNVEGGRRKTFSQRKGEDYPLNEELVSQVATGRFVPADVGNEEARRNWKWDKTGMIIRKNQTDGFHRPVDILKFREMVDRLEKEVEPLKDMLEQWKILHSKLKEKQAREKQQG